MAQGFLSRIRFTPAATRRLMNVWPPFRGAGIRVTHIAPDWREVQVELRQRLLNRNYVGVHFGGSIFAMTDPFHMLMMMHNLGRDFIVWDKAGSVRFLKPGRGTLQARFVLTQQMVDEAREAAADGARHEPTFGVDVTNREGEVVAKVEKTLHIRRADAAGARKAA